MLPFRLRQVALVARDRDAVVADLCAVLGIEVSYHDPGVAAFGLHNAVMPLGDTFLEVVAPVQEDTTAGRYLERLGGDGGYMVLLQTANLAGDRTRLEKLGVRVVWSIELPDIEAMHLHPRDTGGTLVSLDHPEPAESWRWAGPSWPEHRRENVTRRVVGAVLQSPDPSALARRWSEWLALPVSGERDGTRTIALEGGDLQFIVADARGECLAGFAVACANRPAVLAAAEARGLEHSSDSVCVGGVRIHLRDAE